MKKFICTLVLIILVNFVSVPGKAETLTNSDQVAVALVIDHSGSMKNTDPLNERFTAARMVLELMGASDFLSITTFGDEAINILPMTQLGSGMEQAKLSLQSIPETLGYTDYNRALDLAKTNLDSITQEGIRKFIIFLTDGEPRVRDAAIDMNLYLADMTAKVQAFAAAGIPVYTVGFGESSQLLLKDISGVTRGVSFQGDTKTLANNFFEVLRELKNRYTLVNQTVNPGNSSFDFQVDEYTSRVTVLVTDESGTGNVAMVDPSGASIAPVLEQGNLKVYHLNEPSDPGTFSYVLRGNWQGSIRAVRDTKTKLWINDPINNSQLPYESEIIAKVAQTGVAGSSALVTAILKQSGKQLLHPVLIGSVEGGYEINLGRLPQTGNYELEVNLYNGEQLVARTSSNFQVKNIPSLTYNLSDDQKPWIEGEKRIITGSLVRGGLPIKNNLEGVEMTFDLLSGEDKTSLILLDDGQPDSGDLIARDGTYSAILTTPVAGDVRHSFTAKGVYLSEPFLLIKEETSVTINSPGSISIKLPAEVNIGEDRIARISVEILNQGSYPEQITIYRDNKLLFQGVKANPGQSVIEELSIPISDDQTEGEFSFSGLYESTRFIQDRDRVRFMESIPEPNLFSIKNLLIAAGVISGILVIMVLSRKLVKKRKQARLQGKLIYGTASNQLTENIVLAGTQPMMFSIGKDHMTNHHLESDIESGFDFTIWPVFSEKGSSVAELRCTPPGVLFQNGQIMTSTILSPGDEFNMGGLFFRFDYEKDTQHGNDVLKGRL